MDRYWHKLSSLDRYEAKQRLKTDQAVQAAYKAPPWCGLGQDALLYMDGCWSLLLTEESVYPAFCKNCEFCHFDVIEVNWDTTLVTKIHLSNRNKEQADVYNNVCIASEGHFFAIEPHGSYLVGVTYVTYDIPS